MSRFSWESGDEIPEWEDRSSIEDETPPPATGISNRWLAMGIFIAVEAMLFMIFIFSFLFLRAQGGSWPPPGVPPLDIRLAVINLLVLLLSAFLAYSAERSVRRYLITTAERQLLLACGLGALFLAGQLREYAFLFSNGITTTSGLFGAIFYVTIGFHGLHVLSGLVWLLAVWYLTRAARQTPDEHFGVQAAALYWEFVASVWILLFILLYVQ